MAVCAENVSVTLHGVRSKSTRTNNYGDFKFDNLKENSGKYTIQLTYTGYATKTIQVTLTKSLNIGTIFV